MIHRTRTILTSGVCLAVMLAALGTSALAQGQDEAPDAEKPDQPKRKARLVGPAVINVGGFFSPRDPASLLRNAKVQEELKLDEEEKGKVQEINQSLNKRRQELFAAIRGAKGEERKKKQAQYQEKLQAARKEANKETLALLKPPQRTRLDQITLQLRGIRALSDESVVEKLKLSEEQRQKIAALHKSFGKESRQLIDDLRNKKIAFPKYREKRTALTKDRDEKIHGTLTKDQTAEFDKMKGAKFELPRPKLQAVPLKLKVVPGKIRKVKPQKVEPKQQDDE